MTSVCSPLQLLASCEAQIVANKTPMTSTFVAEMLRAASVISLETADSKLTSNTTKKKGKIKFEIVMRKRVCRRLP